MDISFGLKISNFLYDVFPLIAVGFPFLLSTFLLCRKKAQTEQNNSYGVEKETGKDALYKKTAVLMAAATILAAISSIGGHHLYCYTRAKERYEAVHSFTSENLDYMQMLAEFSLYGRRLSDAEDGIAELRNSLSNDSLRNYYQKNPFRSYFYHVYSNGEWESGVLYSICNAIGSENGFANVNYYSLGGDQTLLDRFEHGFWCARSEDKKLFKFIGVAAIGLLFLLYMYPSKIARKKDHDQTVVIVWVNALLGWTLIGWLAMLIWGNSVPKSNSANEQVPASGEAEKILKLKTLMEQGAITPEEYEQKRKELLSKM